MKYLPDHQYYEVNLSEDSDLANLPLFKAKFYIDGEWVYPTFAQLKECIELGWAAIAIPDKTNPADFQGDDYVATRDRDRLTSQIKKIYLHMRDEQWRSLKDISNELDIPHSSVSAQLRNLRKESFGSHKIHRKHLQGGFYLYKLEVNQQGEKNVI